MEYYKNLSNGLKIGIASWKVTTDLLGYKREKFWAICDLPTCFGHNLTSDVNKARSRKAKAKASTRKAKASTHKAKARPRPRARPRPKSRPRPGSYKFFNQ